MTTDDPGSSPDVPQRTLKNAIHCCGTGRQNGARVAMTLRPAPPDLGIVFSRIDLSHRPWVSASWEHAVIDGEATGLVNESGIAVAGIGPLMSALSGCAIDNAMIELDGPEVPAMDGSAAPFVFLLECAGAAKQAAPRRALEIRGPVRIQEKGASLALSPGPGLTLGVTCRSPSAAIGEQSWAVTVDRQSYKREVSRARRFEFLDPADDAEMQERRVDNAVAVVGDRYLDDRPLRFENEFVRHQAQCLIGDLYLAGGPIIGQVTAKNATRDMTIRLLAKLFGESGAQWWSDLSRAERPRGPEAPESVERPAAAAN